MKVAAILSFAALATANLLNARQCGGNNCNRAVTGTRDGKEPASSRSADCASFLLTTVTPAPTTVTVTVDEEAVSTPSKRAILEARQATAVPTAIPAYAAVCSSAAAYAQACSCFGVTASVTTAPRPTVTVTTTIDYCDDL